MVKAYSEGKWKYRERARASRKRFSPIIKKRLLNFIHFFASSHSCGTINYDTMIMLSFKALPSHKHTHSVRLWNAVKRVEHSRWIFDNFNTHLITPDSLTPSTELHTRKEGLDNKKLCFTEIFRLAQARSNTIKYMKIALN